MRLLPRLPRRLLRVVYLALAGVLLQACGHGSEPFQVGLWVQTPSGVSVRAFLKVGVGHPDTLTFGASLANRGSEPAHFGPGCGYIVRAYSRADRAGRPAWSSPTDISCPAQAFWRTLLPGDSVPTSHFCFVFTSAQVLGDSLPEGRYYFTLRPPASFERLEFAPAPPDTPRKLIPPEPVFVPAGNAWLHRGTYIPEDFPLFVPRDCE